MNVWKVSTITLAVGLGLVVGKGAVTSADAAGGGVGSHTGVGFDWGEEQPHMEQALRDLRGAKHSLEAAAEHKGGWRALALKHTDEAINETIRGMEYAKTHRKE
jgi:hypothetical protein